MIKKVLFVVTLAIVAAISLLAADATGKWVAEQPGRNGGPSRQTTLVLKTDGAKLTGTMTVGLGRGGAAFAFAIADGRIDGDRVSFTVKRETPNGTMEIKYAGTLVGDALKLKFTIQTPGGPMDRELTAKRSAN